jgi:hypothetical protein
MNSIIADNIILVYILAAVVILLIVWIIRLEIRLARLLIGKNAKTLEDSFVTISNDLKELHQFSREMEHYLGNVEKRVKRSIQSVETVRFNPFKGTGAGGNQSFSTAFVNEKGDGVVLTSMYTRDRISMFAKPLVAFASEFELTEEEKESIEKAKKNLGA